MRKRREQNFLVHIVSYLSILKLQRALNLGSQLSSFKEKVLIVQFFEDISIPRFLCCFVIRPCHYLSKTIFDLQAMPEYDDSIKTRNLHKKKHLFINFFLQSLFLQYLKEQAMHVLVPFLFFHDSSLILSSTCLNKLLKFLVTSKLKKII